MKAQSGKAWLAIWFGLVLALASPAALAADEHPEPEDASEAAATVEEEVQAEADRQATEQRRQVMQQAVDALARTRDALAALEEERIDEALEALAVTTGKLELLVARNPELALAPTDVTVITHDLYGTPEAIRRVIKRAKDELDDGRIQEARRLLGGLGSELVFRVNNLPLATYPEAIKAIAPLIDEGEIEEARASLQAALNTLVVTERVVPLPLLRSDALLERAEELAAKTDRSEEENEELADDLVAIREQLEIAELLGYVDKKEYRALNKKLEGIERSTAEGDSEQGFFQDLRQSIARLQVQDPGT